MRLSGGRSAATEAAPTRSPAPVSAPPPTLHLPAAAPQLSLEDVARDAFRRKFFLDAFADERDALDRSFAFLQRAREYKQLLGRRDALQTIAEGIVDEFVRDLPPHLCVFMRSPDITALLQRVVDAVDGRRSSPDLFSGLEAHVNDRLEKEKFVAFLQSPQYALLCDALRRHRELPLGEILVDARSTRFLEQFVRQTNAPAMGNLLFWVQVQTVFLPLIQTNVVSVTLFEEIQATVRRLYNHFLTESSDALATIVPETLRKDILKRILQLQGEPFSPSRYATLFRQAQEKIWHWMQTTVYPKFQASMLYVALVVETENLESDRQLRKLSEHVQASTQTSPTSAASKASAIFVPVEPMSTLRPPGYARYLRVVAPRQSEETPCEWTTTLRLPLTLRDDAQIRTIQVIDVVRASEDGEVEFEYALNASHDGVEDSDGAAAIEDDRVDYMDFVWNWRHTIALPALVTSPLHRVHGAVPKPSFHSFSLPSTSHAASTLYGYVVTSWVSHKPLLEGAFEDDNASLTDAGTKEHGVSAPMLLPRFTFVLATQRLAPQRVVPGLRMLAERQLDTLLADDLCDLFPNTQDASVAPGRLKAAFSGFYLQPQLEQATFPVHWIFRELSHQTVVALLGALLVGKSLVLVSPRPAALMLVASALVELLRPLAWQHLVLPLCPVRTACALADRGFFTPSSATSSFSRTDGQSHLPTPTQTPFIIGLEGELVHLKTKESAHEPRHRIRNSIYSVQRVNVQVRRPPPAHTHAVSCQHADTSQYPSEILHTQAIVLDVDADDVYVPDRVDVPEFPQTLVRTLETNLKDARLGGTLATEDSRLFCSPPQAPGFLATMLEGNNAAAAPVAAVDAVRLAVLAFMEALLGDVTLYFCSFRQSFTAKGTSATDTTSTSPLGATTSAVDTFLLFEADAFLDAKMELGCREFFRQVFQTEMFRQFLVRQHRCFALSRV